MYHIKDGSILIDDINIEAYDLSYLRANIAVVLQDVFLFSGSIYDNITLRNPRIKEQEVKHSAKMCGVRDLVMRLPGGVSL